MSIADRLVAFCRGVTAMVHPTWIGWAVGLIGLPLLVLVPLATSETPLPGWAYVYAILWAVLTAMCILVIRVSRSRYVTIKEQEADPIGAAVRRGQRITLFVPSEEVEGFLLDAFFRARGEYGKVKVVVATKNPTGLKTGDPCPDGSIALLPTDLPPCPLDVQCGGYGTARCLCSLWDKWPSIHRALQEARRRGDTEQSERIQRIGRDYLLAMSQNNHGKMSYLERTFSGLFNLVEPILHVAELPAGAQVVIRQSGASFTAVVVDPEAAEVVLRPGVGGQISAGYQDARSRIGSRPLPAGAEMATVDTAAINDEEVNWGVLTPGHELVASSQEGSRKTFCAGCAIERLETTIPLQVHHVE